MSNDVVQLATEANSKAFNILKAVEEASELTEVLTKYLTKAEGYRPSNEKITEEIGDMIVRCKIIAKIFGEEEVERRVKDKSNLLCTYYAKKLATGNPPKLDWVQQT